MLVSLPKTVTDDATTTSRASQLAGPVAHPGSAGTLAAIAWPAPALAIAAIWPLPPRRWPLYLFAVFIAIAATGHFSATSWRTDLGFCFLDVL
jgi:hypothetical protein